MTRRRPPTLVESQKQQQQQHNSMTNRAVAIVGLPLLCAVMPLSIRGNFAAAAAASSEAHGARGAMTPGGLATSSFPIDDDRGRYYLETIRYDGEDDGGLIHVPMRTRSSVLRERNLFRLLEGEMDESAHETFARWWSSRNDVIDYDDDDDEDRDEDGQNYDEDGGRRRRRRRRLAASSSSGSESRRELQETSGGGMHFLNAYVGTPPQRRVLALNNAADFTAFPCEDCTDCGPMMVPYNQSSSPSFLPMPCGRCVGGQRDDVCDETRTNCMAGGINLVDKSAWTAYEARDEFYVVDPKNAFPLVFACQTKATGYYALQVQDGIVGLSMARTSLVNQMVFQGVLKHPRFTMCFEQKLLMGEDQATGGMMILGGYNPQILDHPLVYVQNTEVMPGTRYKVRVNAVYFRVGGGQSIVPDRAGQSVVRLNFDASRFNEKNGGTMMDSGVPMLIFDESIQQSFLTEWEKIVGVGFTLGKVVMTKEHVMSLPTLIIQIKAHDGVDKSFNPRSVPNMAGDLDPDNPFDGLIAIPANHYMEYNPSTATYRAKIILDSKIGSFLGINAMHGQAFVYDLSMDRIGFAESFNCFPKTNLAGGSVDDDMFAVPTIGEGADGSLGTHGTGPFDGGFPGDGTGDDNSRRGRRTCVTATCISFVTLGYCIVIIALGVSYRKYRPRDRSKRFDGLDDETEVMNPVFDQSFRSSGSRSIGGSSLGRSSLRGSYT